MEEAWTESHRDRASARATKLGLLFGGIGAGAILMYLLDPDKGRGRRARLQDRVASKANRLGRVAGSRARDLRNRAQGLAHKSGLVGSSRQSNADRSLEGDEGYESMEQGT
jgi:hypothetical protein